MRKGTTPTFTFTLPFGTDIVQKAKAIFKYEDGTKLSKVVGADNFAGNVIVIKLTQEETLQFRCNTHVKLQLRVLTVGGDALASAVYPVFVEECLDTEVLT